MIIEIDRIDIPALACYASLSEAQLRKREDNEEGIFICESPKVIKVAIDNGYEPLSLLCEAKHITGDAAFIISQFPDIPVYTGQRSVLSQLTGYVLTRGVLCAMKRKEDYDFIKLCSESRLLCVLQGVCDTTNIGAIFRSASALGVDGIVLSSDTCDPLNRRSVRVSMGTVFTVPWVKVSNPVSLLNSQGFTTVSLALRNDALALDDPILKKFDRLAVVFGTEGDGLPSKVIKDCRFVVKIPMYHGVDSLNVAAASAVTFWELRK